MEFTNLNSQQMAQQKCRDSFKVDAHECSHYSNEGCQLHCRVHSIWHSADYTNGKPCPSNSSKVCNEGKCILPSGDDKQQPISGYIDIHFGKGEFVHIGEYYVIACIRNSSQILKVLI